MKKIISLGMLLQLIVELRKLQFTMAPSQVNSHLSSLSQVLIMLSQRLPPLPLPQLLSVFSEESEDLISKENYPLGCLEARVLPESCLDAPKSIRFPKPFPQNETRLNVDLCLVGNQSFKPLLKQREPYMH